jgi:hypothetical protein
MDPRNASNKNVERNQQDCMLDSVRWIEHWPGPCDQIFVGCWAGDRMVEQTVALQRAGDCPAFKGERKRERQNISLMGRQQALQLALLGPGPLDVF